MNPERALTRYIDYSNSINLIERDVTLPEASQQLDCGDLTIVTFNEEKNIEQNGKTIKVRPAWNGFSNSTDKRISHS